MESTFGNVLQCSTLDSVYSTFSSVMNAQGFGFVVTSPWSLSRKVIRRDRLHRVSSSNFMLYHRGATALSSVVSKFWFASPDSSVFRMTFSLSLIIFVLACVSFRRHTRYVGCFTWRSVASKQSFETFCNRSVGKRKNMSSCDWKSTWSWL